MKTISSILATTAVFLFLASCTSDDVATPVIIPNDGQVYTYKMNLEVTVPSGLPSEGGSTRATTTWDNGSTLQFFFFDEKGIATPGTATYSVSEDGWIVTTNQQLSSTSSLLDCSATYLQPDENGDTPSFLTPAYGGSSTYTCTDKVINVNALVLDPVTWRLRFKGTKGKTFDFFSSDVRDCNDKTMTDTLRLVIANDGFSPYIYAASHSNKDSIRVCTDGNLYVHAMASGRLGSSTTLDLPTTANYEANGWKIIKQPSASIEPEAIDLGLPSGTLWANMNVGASRPEEAGLYFAWGETVGYSSNTSDGRSFDWRSYQWMTQGKTDMLQVNSYQVPDGKTSSCWYDAGGSFIGDGKTVLEVYHDAAAVNWKDDWTMPTYEEIQELLSNTTHQWTTENGVSGRRFTGKNGKSIFLPVTGMRENKGLDFATRFGYYWSSSLNVSNSGEARRLYFSSYDFDAIGSYRSLGRCVRPVKRARTISVSNTVVRFDSNSDNKTLTLTCTESWTASVDQWPEVNGASSWCTVTPAYGTNGRSLTISVEANTSNTSRVARVNILGITSGNHLYVTVTQKAKPQTPPDTDKEKTFTVNGVSFKMIRVEAGSFSMGSSNFEDEKWAHTVTLTKDYYVAETEVTQELWEAFKKNNSQVKRGNQYPVNNVSWNDCDDFINLLNKATGQTFRMPTEAEWEYAARGGKKSKGYTFAGSNTCQDVAWYGANSYDVGTTHDDYGMHPVKSKQPNELGLYDMSGNVKEWCADWYDKSGYGAQSKTDPTGPDTGTGRVLRGGSWSAQESYCRTSKRDSSSPTKSNSGNGLRLVLTSK